MLCLEETRQRWVRRVTPDRAWQRGLQVLLRYPWLALIPMGWNLAQMALAWCGVPLEPVPDVGLLADQGYQALVLPQSGDGGAGIAIRAFLPSWLPSITDLQVSLQPESLAMPVRSSTTAILLGQLLVPLLHAVATATYLVLVAQVVTRGELPARERNLQRVEVRVRWQWLRLGKAAATDGDSGPQPPLTLASTPDTPRPDPEWPHTRTPHPRPALP